MTLCKRELTINKCEKCLHFTLDMIIAYLTPRCEEKFKTDLAAVSNSAGHISSTLFHILEKQTMCFTHIKKVWNS